MGIEVESEPRTRDGSKMDRENGKVNLSATDSPALYLLSLALKASCSLSTLLQHIIEGNACPPCWPPVLRKESYRQIALKLKTYIRPLHDSLSAFMISWRLCCDQ